MDELLRRAMYLIVSGTLTTPAVLFRLSSDMDDVAMFVGEHRSGLKKLKISGISKADRLKYSVSYTLSLTEMTILGI